MRCIGANVEFFFFGNRGEKVMGEVLTDSVAGESIVEGKPAVFPVLPNGQVHAFKRFYLARRGHDESSFHPGTRKNNGNAD